jgi:hypothetical protein
MRRALAFALLMVPLVARAQDEDPLARAIRDATAKATGAIAKAVTPPPPGPLPRAITFSANSLARPLEALALLRAGGAAEKKVARELLDDWWHDCVERDQGCTNYELALAISAFEGLTVERLDDPHPTTTVTRYEAKPIPGDVKERLAMLTRTLLAGRHGTFEDRGCAWSYDTASWQRSESTKTTDRAAKTRERMLLRGRLLGAFDNSNAQFSVLALHDAARGGIAIPQDVVRLAAKHFLLCAERVHGPTGPEIAHWGYKESGYSPSMTFAGLSSLGIARDLGCKDDEIEKTIKAALPGVAGAVAQIPPPGRDPQSGFSTPYDLYSLEKALDTLDVKELDGKDWFAPLAHKVLDAQGADGLWGSGDVIDSSLYVLFLTRATVSRARLVDGRSTGAGATDSLGEVFIGRIRKTVDGIVLLHAYADASAGSIVLARQDAEEAIRAFEQEGHGREAALLGGLAALIRRGGDRKDNATRWAHDICGKNLPLEDLDAWDATVRHLHETGDVAALRQTLSEKAPLPVRAFAASELARIPCPDATPDVAGAAEALAGEPILETGAGARCARALGDALTALTQSVLPALPEKGPVAAADLKAVVEAARAKRRALLDERIDKAAAAYDAKDASWPSLKAGISDKVSLQRMLDRSLYRLLRAVTGELIPDDGGAWKTYLGG